jgi:hypothetical protein
MARSAMVTIRMPEPLKHRMQARARISHRSLSAQVVSDLGGLVLAPTVRPTRGRFLGIYAGTRVPSDKEFREVRARLWGNLTTGWNGDE